MKIYQIIKKDWLNIQRYPIVYTNDHLHKEDTVDERVKDFIKLSDNIYGTFMSLEPDCIVTIAEIPDYMMIEGTLFHFNMLNITRQQYLILCQQKIVPKYKKLKFEELINKI